MKNPTSEEALTHGPAKLLTSDAPSGGKRSTLRPTHQQIAERAYDIFVSSGRRPGRCQLNWHQAEREMTYQMNSNERGRGLDGIYADSDGELSFAQPDRR
jgi:hypothetical protein